MSSVSLSSERLAVVWYMSFRDGNSGAIGGLWSRLGAPIVPTLGPTGGPPPMRPIAAHHVHDAEPDVDGGVRDALEIAVDQKVAGACLDIQLALRHSADDVFEVLVVQLVHRIIDLDDVPHGFRVAMHKRLDGGVDHGDRAIRHLLDSCDVRPFDDMPVSELEGEFSQVLPVPANPV